VARRPATTPSVEVIPSNDPKIASLRSALRREVIYALLGLGIFGGYTVLDFNRMRSAGTDDAVSIAAGIFLDILNVFMFFLQLFGRGKE
jgi:FtsH-binding integral membrane protein